MALRVQYFRNPNGKNFWEIIDTYEYVTVAEAYTKSEAINKAKRLQAGLADGYVYVEGADIEILNTDGTYNRTIEGRR